jgi:hypothetical protein
MAELNPGDMNFDLTESEKDLSPIPFDDNPEPETEVSHAPLNLGGANTPTPPPAAKLTPAAKPAPKPSIPPAKPTASTTSTAKPQVSAAPGGRITAVKIFFTKLHAGAMDFLSEQITEWLKNNPGITIKRTNIAVGEVAAKKTEPNLIITVWY